MAAQRQQGDDEQSVVSSDAEEMAAEHRELFGQDLGEVGSTASESESEEMPPLPWYTIRLAFLAALTSTNDGFDIGVSAGAAGFLQQDLHLSDSELSIFFGSLAMLSAVGGLFAHSLADRQGRRVAFVASQLAVLLGVAVATSAGSFGVLMTGRVICGLGVGVGMTIVPMYVAETSPSAHRGRLTAWCEIAFNVGVVLGFLANLKLKDLPDGVNWRAMVGCGLPLPALLTMLVPLTMPESPRWLVSKGRLKEAAAILERCNAPGEDVLSLVRRIEREVVQTKEWKQLGYMPLFRPDRSVRRAVFVAFGVALAAQLTGMSVVVTFAPRIFKSTNLGASKGSELSLTLVLGIVKMVFIIISASFVDTSGRRPLLLGSSTMVSLCLLLLAISFATETHWLAIAAVLTYMASFSLGLGPIGWIYPAELFPSNLRARGLGVAVFLNRMASALMSATFLTLCNFMGTALYFLGLSALAATVAVLVWVYAPETRQRSLEGVTARPEPDSGESSAEG